MKIHSHYPYFKAFVTPAVLFASADLLALFHANLPVNADIEDAWIIVKHFLKLDKHYLPKKRIKQIFR